MRCLRSRRIHATVAHTYLSAEPAKDFRPPREIGNTRLPPRPPEPKDLIESKVIACDRSAASWIIGAALGDRQSHPSFPPVLPPSPQSAAGFTGEPPTQHHVPRSQCGGCSNVSAYASK